ncbi:MAG: hypothetical protein ACRD9W_29575, partial [Terriglobia bacterium]
AKPATGVILMCGLRRRPSENRSQGETMPSPSESICAYIHGKDRNRPHMLGHAFAPTATVEVIAKTPTISFPSMVTGLDSIADVFVRQFARTYENVYTLCLCSPPSDDSPAFSCDWLVGMSEKESGAVRVGCGRYDWSFEPDSRLVEKLVITIDVMQKLGPGRLRPVMDWVTAMPYPWCPADVAARSARQIADLAETMRRLSASTSAA